MGLKGKYSPYRTRFWSYVARLVQADIGYHTGTGAVQLSFKTQRTESLSVGRSIERLTECLKAHFYCTPNFRIWTTISINVVFTYNP